MKLKPNSWLLPVSYWISRWLLWGNCSQLDHRKYVSQIGNAGRQSAGHIWWNNWPLVGWSCPLQEQRVRCCRGWQMTPSNDNKGVGSPSPLGWWLQYFLGSLEVSQRVKSPGSGRICCYQYTCRGTSFCLVGQLSLDALWLKNQEDQVLLLAQNTQVWFWLPKLLCKTVFGDWSANSSKQQQTAASSDWFWRQAIDIKMKNYMVEFEFCDENVIQIG